MADPKQEPTNDEKDLRSRQLDPEHENYWKSRGLPERPEDYLDRPAPAPEDGKTTPPRKG